MTPRERAQRTAEAIYRAWRKAPAEPEATVLTDMLEKAITDVLETSGLPNGHSQNALGNGLRHILSSSPAVLFSFKASGDYAPTFISDNISTLLGYNPAEYLKDPEFWRRRVHPDDDARVEAEFVRLFDTGYYAQEYRFLHKDGRYRWLRDEQHLIRGKTGEPVEVVGSWSDITLRKKLEHEKEGMKARLEYLITASPAVIYSYEATGDYAPTFISDNFIELLGYEPQEYLEDAEFWQRGVHPEDIPRVLSAMPTLFEEGQISHE